MVDANDTADPMVRTQVLEGDLRQTVLVLALPVLGEQFLNFCVSFYDVFLAGNLPAEISTAATAAVGVAGYVGWLATLLFALVSIGTSALVSRARGAGDDADANRVLNRSITLSLLTGLAFFAFIVPLAPRCVGWLGLRGTTADVAVHYLRVDAVGLVFASVSFVGAAALRGCGNMRLPMWVMGTVSVVNIVASTALVYGFGPIPALGVDGIVGGTVIARVCGGLLMLFVLARGASGLQLDRHELRLQGETVRRLLRVGLPALADGVILWTGHCLFIRIISSLGETQFAAHTIGVRVEAISYLPALAWGTAAATVIGQSLGAGQPQRAVQAGNEAVRQVSLLGLVVGIMSFAFATQIFDWMHNQPAVRAAGIPAFRVMALFQLFNMVAIVYLTGLRGAGDTRFPLVLSIVGTLGLRLSLAYVGGVVLQGGLLGAWTGMFADMLFRAIASTLRFRYGRWTATRV